MTATPAFFHVRPPARCLRLLAVACALVAGHAGARAPVDTLAEARALMAQQQADAAWRRLAPEESRRAGEPAYDYLLGIAALDSGRTSQAIFALERVLAVEPENNLARAEIARAYLAAGEQATARDQLRQARLGAMPAAAAAAIDRVLSALGAADAAAQADGRPVATAYAELGGGYDTNANSATSAGQFAVPALPGAVFLLEAESRRRPDTFLASAAGGNLQLRLDDRWSLQATANARATAYADVHALRNRQLDGAAAATYTVGAHQFSAGVQSVGYWLDGTRYRNAHGGTAQWQVALGEVAQASVFGQASRIRYADAPSRDADRRVLGAGYARVLGGGDAVAFGSAYAVREAERDAANPQHGHRGAGVRAGVEWRRGAHTPFATASHERRRYHGADPDFDATRRDRQTELALGLHWDAAPRWRITPQLSHVRAASNIVLYDYRRTVTQVTARHTF